MVASDGGKDGGVILTAADGRNITLETVADVDLKNFGLADSKSGGNAKETFYAGFTLTAANASTDIVITGGNGTGNGNIANSGLQAGTYSAQTAVTGNTDKKTIATGTSITTADLNQATLTGVSATNKLGIDFGSAATR